MPTTAGDQRFLRWFARLVAFGLAAILLGRLIDPRLAGDATHKETPA